MSCMIILFCDELALPFFIVHLIFRWGDSTSESKSKVSNVKKENTFKKKWEQVEEFQFCQQLEMES